MTYSKVNYTMTLSQVNYKIVALVFTNNQKNTILYIHKIFWLSMTLNEVNKMKIIDKLCELYNSNKINYNSDDNVVLEYDDKYFIDYEIDISLNKQEDKYLIFIFIEQGQKLIFKGLLEESNNSLNNTYDVLKKDLYELELDVFIEKYSEKLFSNLYYK